MGPSAGPQAKGTLLPWEWGTACPHCRGMGTANPFPHLAKGLPALQGPGVTPASGHHPEPGWLYPALLSLPVTL